MKKNWFEFAPPKPTEAQLKQAEKLIKMATEPVLDFPDVSEKELSVGVGPFPDVTTSGSANHVDPNDNAAFWKSQMKPGAPIKSDAAGTWYAGSTPAPSEPYKISGTGLHKMIPTQGVSGLGCVPSGTPSGTPGTWGGPIPSGEPTKKVWTSQTAKPVINWAQLAVRAYGYHVCLGGGVLNNGSSEKDLDLYFLPMNNETPPDPVGLVGWIEASFGKLEAIGNNYPGKELPYIYKGKCDAAFGSFGKLLRIDVFIMGTLEQAELLKEVQPVTVELSAEKVEHFKKDPDAAFTPLTFKGKSFIPDLPKSVGSKKAPKKPGAVPLIGNTTLPFTWSNKQLDMLIDKKLDAQEAALKYKIAKQYASGKMAEMQDKVIEDALFDSTEKLFPDDDIPF